MPTQIKINLSLNSFLGITLNCIRWGSFTSGTEWCSPLPSLHPGPLWPGVVQPVRAPIKVTSWPASFRGSGWDSILGEQKHCIETSGKATANDQRGQKRSHPRSHSKRRKIMVMINFNVVFCSFTQNTIPSFRKATAHHQCFVFFFFSCSVSFTLVQKVFCREHLRSH